MIFQILAKLKIPELNWLENIILAMVIDGKLAIVTVIKIQWNNSNNKGPARSV